MKRPEPLGAPGVDRGVEDRAAEVARCAVGQEGATGGRGGRGLGGGGGCGGPWCGDASARQRATCQGVHGGVLLPGVAVRTSSPRAAMAAPTPYLRDPSLGRPPSLPPRGAAPTIKWAGEPGDDDVGDHELVTVMVPARNEAGFLPACLASIRAQDYPRAADRRGRQCVDRLHCAPWSGGTVRRTSGSSSSRWTSTGIPDGAQPRASPGLGAAGWSGSTRTRPSPANYVSTAVSRLREGRWGGVGGRKDGVGRTPAGRAVAVAMSSRLAVGDSTYHFGTRPQEVDHLPFGAYPVALVHELGGWDESLAANEDFEFDYRLRGGPVAGCCSTPDLVIAWHCRQSIGDLFRQYHRYGRGKVDVAVLHPDSLGPRHVAPPLFVLYLARGATGRPAPPPVGTGHARPVRRRPRRRVGAARAAPGPAFRAGCACPWRSRRCTSAGDSASGRASVVWHGPLSGGFRSR